MTVSILRGVTNGASTGYGEAELPSFGAGYAAHWLGTKFTANPERNLFGGASATVVGTPGTVGLTATDETSYIELPDFSRTIFEIADAVTLIAIGKGVTQSSLLADDRASVGNMGIHISAGNTQFFATDSNAVTININTNSSATYGTVTNDRWTMYGATMTTTAANTFIQRSGLARAVGTANSRSAGDLGSASKKLRFGRGYSSSTAAATSPFIGVWTKVLSADEIDRVWSFLSRNMLEVGETL